MDWIEVAKVVHDKFSEIQLVLLDPHHDALGELVASVSCRVGSISQYLRRLRMDKAAELLPPWLRFMRGLVDTADLPLNVSREMLQTTPVLARIRKALRSPSPSTLVH